MPCHSRRPLTSSNRIGADGEDVAAPIGAARELLRRHVVGAPLEHAGLGLERRVARLGDAEVDDLGLPVEGHEDVVRADVAVHEAERLAVEVGELVRVVERRQHVAQDRQRHALGKAARAARSA